MLVAHSMGLSYQSHIPVDSWYVTYHQGLDGLSPVGNWPVYCLLLLDYA